MKTIDSDLSKKLWSAADSLRGNISSEQYMIVVIGLLFLKYMSDKYENTLIQLKKDHPENYKYFANNKDILASKYNCSFFVPPKASWNYIAEYASSKEEIGSKIDQAFLLIEEQNVELKNLLDKNYNRKELDPIKLGQVITEFTDIDLEKYGEDVIGRTYEYFLGNFFKKQGQKGGEFYTPASIVQLLVELIEPNKGRIYDPACGTGGMFVQARRHMQTNNLKPNSLIVYGQEYQNKIWKLAKINLLLHNFNSLDINLGPKSADTFSDDLFKGEEFDFILANPPFNIKKWGYKKLIDDVRWKWGIPPQGNANYAWLSHILTKLNSKGHAGIVLANGSLSSQQKGELQIRKNLIKENKVDAIIALPDKLFYTTTIPACLWIFNNNKKHERVLMIHANELEGNMLSKRLRELTDSEINKVSSLYKKHKKGEVINETGFAKSVVATDIEENDYSFMPGRYIDIDFEENQIDKEKLINELKKLLKEIPELINDFKKTASKVNDSLETVLKKIEKSKKIKLKK